jgi:selenocysteine lyase/cysteine desulfurase
LKLCHQLVEGLTNIPGLQVYGITEPPYSGRRVPTVSFTLEGMTPWEISSRLGEANIFAWAGNFYALAISERLGLEEQGGFLRVGLAHYNTAEEVDMLLEVLSDLPR